MGVNSMSFEDISAILNDVNKAVTGNEAAIAPKDTKEFVSVATTLIQGAMDPLAIGVNQVISNTIFSIRPYYRKFADLQRTDREYGAITRKLTPIDRDAVKDPSWDLPDGQSVDPWKINKMHVLMTNFYGQAHYMRDDTTTTKQLKNAFRGPDEFGEFFSMKESNMRDQIEQDLESLSRMTVANFAAGKYALNNGVIHLLTEYNQHTGQSLTDVTVYHPDNFKPFCDWLYSRIDELAALMGERTGLFQVQVQNKPVNRHTEGNVCYIYLFRKLKTEIEKRVLANTYHDTYLTFARNEAVNFWQNVAKGQRDKISVKPSYMDTQGNIVESATVINVDKVVGIMHDRDAIGYNLFDIETLTTPVNARGRYWNTAYHYSARYFNDFTEKGILLLLD